MDKFAGFDGGVGEEECDVGGEGDGWENVGNNVHLGEALVQNEEAARAPFDVGKVPVYWTGHVAWDGGKWC